MKDKLVVQSEAREDKIHIYTLSGNLFGTTEGYAFQDEVQKVAATGVRGIIIDFSAVKRIDSSGVGIVVAMMWSASQAGGKLIVAALPERVKKVLSISMLLDHIDNAETVPEALAKLDAQ